MDYFLIISSSILTFIFYVFSAFATYTKSNRKNYTYPTHDLNYLMIVLALSGSLTILISSFAIVYTNNIDSVYITLFWFILVLVASSTVANTMKIYKTLEISRGLSRELNDGLYYFNTQQLTQINECIKNKNNYSNKLKTKTFIAKL